MQLLIRQHLGIPEENSSEFFNFSFGRRVRTEKGGDVDFLSPLICPSPFKRSIPARFRPIRVIDGS